MFILRRGKDRRSFDAKRLPLPPPPDGHLLPNCWRCRVLENDASQYRVRPSSLMVWREQLKKAAGWALLIAFVAALGVGLFAFGMGEATGYGLERAANLGCGFFIASLAMGVLAGTVFLTSSAMAKLDVLRKEKE